MKTTIATIALCLGFTFANAQNMKDTEVPAAVKEAFAKKYPNSKVKTWEKEKADYEVEFELDKSESSAVFEANGTFKELEQEIKISELPAKVTDYCSKNFAGYKIEEAAKITGADGNVLYEAEMKKGKKKFDAIFNDKDAFVKKSEPSMKEEEKD